MKTFTIIKPVPIRCLCGLEEESRMAPSGSLRVEDRQVYFVGPKGTTFPILDGSDYVYRYVARGDLQPTEPEAPATPPFDLVQLSTLPESVWRGRAVFHPHEQHGDVPTWGLTEDDVAAAVAAGEPAPELGSPCYDVGVVLDWWPDEDFKDLNLTRVQFLHDSGSKLVYCSTNLWTPR